MSTTRNRNINYHVASVGFESVISKVCTILVDMDGVELNRMSRDMS